MLIEMGYGCKGEGYGGEHSRGSALWGEISLQMSFRGEYVTLELRAPQCLFSALDTAL